VNVIYCSCDVIGSVIQFKIDHIAYRNRISAFDAFHTKLSFDTTFIERIIFGLHSVPTSGRFINESGHFLNLGFSKGKKMKPFMSLKFVSNKKAVKKSQPLGF
jgi:hypothetical protein